MHEWAKLKINQHNRNIAFERFTENICCISVKHLIIRLNYKLFKVM